MGAACSGAADSHGVRQLDDAFSQKHRPQLEMHGAGGKQQPVLLI